MDKKEKEKWIILGILGKEGEIGKETDWLGREKYVIRDSLGRKTEIRKETDWWGEEKYVIDEKYFSGVKREVKKKVDWLGREKYEVYGPLGKEYEIRKEKEECFITTACVEATGLPDDCLELNIFRQFRDEYVKTRIDDNASL